MKFFKSATVFILLLVRLALPHPAAGHGFAGARFFPATLSTDDPSVNDELSLPTISTIETWECVSLIPALTPGTYKVVWRITSADTHVTGGDFHFQIVP